VERSAVVVVERGLRDRRGDQPGERVGLVGAGRASQMRTSTVPNAWWGRTLHQIWVGSTIEPVSARKLT
jgi:hypothetical protein